MNSIILKSIQKNARTQQKNNPTYYGRVVAVHENGPSDKYRYYYWDRKAKLTQTHNKK